MFLSTRTTVFNYQQPNIKTERLIRIQNDETVSESEDEFINRIGNQISQFCNQIEQRDDISIISEV